MTDSTDAAGPIDADVAAVLAGLGLRAAAATRITGLPSRRSDHATFRVVLDDGRVLKVRRMSRAARATRFARHVRRLAHARLPAVLAVDGRVVVETWIEGTSLRALPLSPERLAQAADVLGAFHATGRDDAPGHGRAPTRTVLRRARRHLGHLAALGALDPGATNALLDTVERFAPADAPCGLTHNDLCAANVVEDAHGRLFVVDNEGLRRGFFGFDLARTWYRWPMPPTAWTAFLERYAVWRDPGEEVAAAPFWRIAAVARSARLRLARESPRAAVPVGTLRALAVDPTCGPRAHG